MAVNEKSQLARLLETFLHVLASPKPTLTASHRVTRFSLRWRQAAVISVCLPPAALLGCAHITAPAPPPSAPLRPDFADKLRVLRVGGEIGGAAGYPISPAMAISSGHQFSNSIRCAAVEGVPMLVGNFADRMRMNRDDLSTREDWVVLLGTQRRFTPNIIDPTARPQPGDRVILGGFFLAGMNFTRKEFWRIPPAVIEGVVVDSDPRTEEQTGLVLVEAPAGRYDGFSGGPAACADSDGNLRVWGTIVYQGYLEPRGLRRYVLGVAPLPADIRERRLWKSY